MLTNLAFIISLLVNLNDLKEGSAISPIWAVATILFGLKAIQENLSLYFNKFQG
jgi:hypothetical protein